MFKGKLRQYQQETVEFMKGKKAVFIGHDMGLGKTPICLNYCELIKQYYPDNKVLILSPSSVINNWKNEIEKFTDSSYTVIEGNAIKRQKQWNENVYYYITNYEKLRTDKEIFKLWGIIIADECTKLKSFTSQLTQKAGMLKANKKIALSGFPIQNSPVDMYSIVSYFLIPYYFGRYGQFKEKYIVTEEQTNKQGFRYSKVIGYQNLDDLKQKISPFFIRKTKKEVLTELPPLIFETLECELTLNQQDIFNTILNDIDIYQPQLEKLTALKLLSDHPLLLKYSNGDLLQTYSNMVNDTRSNKLDLLLEFLEESKESKIVVFSMYAKMIDLIHKNLKIDHTIISGNNTKQENDNTVNYFKNNIDCRILLSTDIGAYGLNLQEASIIIHYDLPWNPAVYKQRIDRLYRMGQMKGIVCVNLICNNIIEKRVLQILTNKINLIEQVIDGGIEDDFKNQILEVLK